MKQKEVNDGEGRSVVEWLTRVKTAGIYLQIYNNTIDGQKCIQIANSNSNGFGEKQNYIKVFLNVQKNTYMSDFWDTSCNVVLN